MSPRDTDRPPIRFVEDLLPAYSALRERVLLLEAGTKQRFDTGAEAFVRMDAKLDEVKEMASDAKSLSEAATVPKPVPWSKVIPIIMTLLVTGGGIVWALAKNPDRAEFDSKVGQVQDQIDDLKSSGVQLSTEQVRIRGSLEFQSASLERVERKLDTLLVSDKKRGGR